MALRSDGELANTNCIGAHRTPRDTRDMGPFGPPLTAGHSPPERGTPGQNATLGAHDRRRLRGRGTPPHRATRPSPGRDARPRRGGVSPLQRAQCALRDRRHRDARLRDEHVRALRRRPPGGNADPLRASELRAPLAAPRARRAPDARVGVLRRPGGGSPRLCGRGGRRAPGARRLRERRRGRPDGNARVPRAERARPRVPRLHAGHPGGPPREDAARARSLRPQRAAP